MNDYQRILLFTYVPFVFLFAPELFQVWAEHNNNDTASSDCDIIKYIEKLQAKWTVSQWPEELPTSCMKMVLLYWAYLLDGAIDGKNKTETQVALDKKYSDPNIFCREFKNDRIVDRSSLDAMADVFRLLLKVANVVGEKTELCPLIAAGCKKSFFISTRDLVKKMNSLAQRQNRLKLDNQVDKQQRTNSNNTNNNSNNSAVFA